MNIRHFLFGGIILAMFVSCGCAKPGLSATPQAPELTINPLTPEPKPEPDWDGLAQKGLEAGMAALSSVNISDIKITKGADHNTAKIAAQAGSYKEISDRYHEAAAGIADKLPFIDEVRVTSKVDGDKDWRLCAALAGAFENAPGEAITSCCVLESVADAQYGVVIRFMGMDIDKVDEFAEPENALSARFVYYYLNTVFDEEGKMLSAEETGHYEYSSEYLSNVVYPLAGYENKLKDCWYRDRDEQTRRHMGADIRVPEGTPILSCTDGYVKYIGVNRMAGNYVIIEDDEGFEYHYYHMVRLTDFLNVGERVTGGQVVGFVGSTGNSVANHLHLAVVTPDNRHVNPFELMSLVVSGEGAN